MKIIVIVVLVALAGGVAYYLWDESQNDAELEINVDEDGVEIEGDTP